MTLRPGRRALQLVFANWSHIPFDPSVASAIIKISVNEAPRRWSHRIFLSTRRRWRTRPQIETVAIRVSAPAAMNAASQSDHLTGCASGLRDQAMHETGVPPAVLLFQILPRAIYGCIGAHESKKGHVRAIRCTDRDVCCGLVAHAGTVAKPRIYR
jgi:hypothetical protein